MGNTKEQEFASFIVKEDYDNLNERGVGKKEKVKNFV